MDEEIREFSIFSILFELSPSMDSILMTVSLP